MNKPSEEQKEVLAQQLAAMTPEQWLSMVSFYIEKFVLDQEFVLRLLFEEATRRRNRMIEVFSADNVPVIHRILRSVFIDLGLEVRVIQ